MGVQHLSIAGGTWDGLWSIVLLLQHHCFVVILSCSESWEEQLSGSREGESHHGPVEPFLSPPGALQSCRWKELGCVVPLPVSPLAITG